MEHAERPSPEAERGPPAALRDHHGAHDRHPRRAAAPAVAVARSAPRPDPRSLLPWLDAYIHTAHDAPAIHAMQQHAASIEGSARAASLIATLHERAAGDEVSNLHLGADPAALSVLHDLDAVDDVDTRREMLARFQQASGRSLDATMSETLDAADVAQARNLISPERDRAEQEVAAMDPAARAALADRADAVASEVLAITRCDDGGGVALDQDHARQASDRLATRSPAELEAIRTATRAQTRGHASLDEEIARSMTGGDRDEATAALSGDPVHAAVAGLVNASGDPRRSAEIVRHLDPAQVEALRGRMPSDWIAGELPDGPGRAEVEALLAGDRAGADAAHLGGLLDEPDLQSRVLAAKGFTPAEREVAEHSDEAILAAFEGKSSAELVAARAAWDQRAAQTGEPTWDDTIAERFEDADPDHLARMQALGRGDRVDDRAIALRAGLARHDQAAIEAALANPAMQARDPATRATAGAEQASLASSVRARDQAARQVFGYLTDEIAPGRDLSTQLADHYAYVAAHDPDAEGGVVERLVAFADHDERAAVRAAQAHDDAYATAELARDGALGTVTRARRAQVADDAHGEAALLDGLDGGALDEAKAEFDARYHRDLLAAPDPDARAEMTALARLLGDDRDPDLIARDDMSRDELRLDNLRQFGARSDRAPAFEVQLQREEREHSRSGALEIHDRVHEVLGGNAGTEQLADDALAATDAQLTPATNPLGLGRHLRDDVSRRDFDRTDRGATDAQDAQRHEKLALAQRSGAAIDTLTQVASLVTLQPELMLLTEAAGGAIKMATKSSIAGHDYAPHDDLADIGRNLGSTGLMLGGFHLGGKVLEVLGEAVRNGTIGIDTAEAIAKSATGNVGATAAGAGAGGAGGTAGAGAGAVAAPAVNAGAAAADETAKASGVTDSASKGERAATDVAEQGAPEATSAIADEADASTRSHSPDAPSDARGSRDTTQGEPPATGLGPSIEPDATVQRSAPTEVSQGRPLVTQDLVWDGARAKALESDMERAIPPRKRVRIAKTLEKLEESPYGPDIIESMTDPRIQAADGYDDLVRRLISLNRDQEAELLAELRDGETLLADADDSTHLDFGQKSRTTERGEPGHYDLDAALVDSEGKIERGIQSYRPSSDSPSHVLKTARKKMREQVLDAPSPDRSLTIHLDTPALVRDPEFADGIADLARSSKCDVAVILPDGTRILYRGDVP